MTDFTAVASIQDVPPDSAKAVIAGGRPVLICNSDGRIFAIENRCSHAEQPLDCGRVKRGWIMCPAHGARFDLESGEPISGPTDRPVATFEVRVVDGRIEVAV
jgi:3-phenylpropionate/trans-cinnamate dioxygenase ferredoxin subunit